MIIYIILRFMFSIISATHENSNGLEAYSSKGEEVKKIISLLIEIVTILRGLSVHKKRWLTPQELEIEYALKEKTMVHYRAANKIPFSKIGTKLIRYDREKIDQWLENNEIVGI